MGAEFGRRACLAVLVILFCAWGLGLKRYLHLRSHPELWTPVTAKVVFSDPHAADQNVPAGQGAALFLPPLFFEYHVNGERFLGDAKSLLKSGLPSREAAHAFAAGFPAGKEFSLYYWPEKPHRISTIRLLQPGLSAQLSGGWVLILSSAVLAIICPLLLRRAWPLKPVDHAYFQDDWSEELNSALWSGIIEEASREEELRVSSETGKKSVRGSGVH